jgi:hypothetical protein
MTPEEIAVIRRDMDQLRNGRDEPDLRRKGFKVLVDCEAMLDRIAYLQKRAELQERLIAALDAARQTFNGSNEQQVLNAAFLSRDIRRELAVLERTVPDA